jgi:TP901 family phage tail tape measure protein
VASKLYEIAFQIGGKLQGSLAKSVTTAAGQLDKLGQQISALEKAQGTSSRFRALHNEIAQTKLKLAQAEGQVRHMGTIVGPMTADMARKFSSAKANVEALRLQFRAEVTELKGVKSAMDAAGISTRTFAADNARLAASLAKAQAAQKAARENLGARAANKKSREEARGNLRSSLGTAAVAAAGVAAWILPVKITADFEDSMVRAGALAKATDGEYKTLTDTARKLGRDTRFSATQAATGMQFLAQSGFKTNEILAAMPGMLNIAAAGQVELGEAADITSNILRGFGMQADQSGRLGDVMTNTFTNSSTTLSMLGETMKYVGPVAKAMGLSLEGTAAAAGLLGTAGIKGEQAGTGLRAMLLRLAAPMAAGRTELQRLGIKTMDAHKNMRPLADILADLSKKTAKFGTGARQASIKAIFGMEAATAATVLMAEAGSGNLQKFTTMVGKSGTASEIAAKQNATMKGQWDNLKGSVEDVAIQIGTMMIPTLKRLIDQVVPVINNVTTWLQEHPKLTEAIVLGGAALAVTVLGITVAGVAYNGIRVAILATHGVMLLMNAATWKAAAAWAAVNAPLMLALVGVAGLAYAAKNLYDNWNPVAQWFAELWDDALDGIGRYMGAIRTLGKVANYIPGMSALSGAVATIPDIGTNHRAERNRKFGEEAFNRRAPYSSLGGPMREDRQQPWSMLDGIEKLTPSSKGGDTTISFSPQITVAPGAASGARGEVEKGMDAAKKEFEKMMKGFMHQEGRLAFGD